MRQGGCGANAALTGYKKIALQRGACPVVFCCALPKRKRLKSEVPQRINSRYGTFCHYIVAEREGFEPPEVLPSTVFKTAAISRSAISPRRNILNENRAPVNRKEKGALRSHAGKLASRKGQGKCRRTSLCAAFGGERGL